MTSRTSSITIRDIQKLKAKLEIDLGMLVNCTGIFEVLDVSISKIEPRDDVIAVEGEFQCIEIGGKTKRSGCFKIELDKDFNIMKYEATK